MTQKILSPTSINTYLRCPRKYYLKYIKGSKEKTSIHLIRGKAVHDAIAGFHKMDLTKFNTFEEMKIQLLSRFNQAWVNQKEEIQKLKLPERILNEYHDESIEMLTGWLKRYLKAVQNGQAKPRTEVRLFSQNHRVMGIIDAIHKQDGRATITDYKTSRKDDLTHDIKVQMAIYALLYQENFGVLPESVTIDFLKFEDAVPFKVTDEFIDYAVRICKEVHEKTTSLSERDYPCNCGGWCEKDFL